MKRAEIHQRRRDDIARAALTLRLSELMAETSPSEAQVRMMTRTLLPSAQPTVKQWLKERREAK